MSFGAWFFNDISIPLILLQVCFLLGGLSASSETDMITSLPGQPSVSFNQYAGYVSVDDRQDKALFYYFVEAENEPQTKPLVLWLNGGPGCTSTGAAFWGYGPFMPTGEEANMLFLDSPARAGFSYSLKPIHNFTNDDITARDNLVFLLKWFEQYPEYKNRDFFITGKSYAGHFVPQLAKLTLQSRLKSNLKGIAIGSPLLDLAIDYNSQAEFLWSHGLISDSAYSMLQSTCNTSQILRESLEGNMSAACSQVYNQLDEEIGQFVTTNDVLLNVCSSSSSSQAKEDDIDECLVDKTIKYFNRKDVQKALHVKAITVEQLGNTGCTDVNYNWEDIFVPTLPLLGELVKAGVRVVIHSGDQDALVPFIGTRTQVDTLAKTMGLNTTIPYRSWLQDKQVGGWTHVYGDMLSFVTVRGAGHTSPYTQPKRTFAVFRNFLKGEPLPTDS